MIPSSTKPQTRTAHIHVREDGIIHVEIKDGVHQTVADAEENILAAVAATGGEPKRLLVDIRKSQLLDPDVRQFYAKLPLADSFKALAILTQIGPWGAAMGNIYLAVARHAIPTRLFSKLELAVAWLKTH